jgi:uncharacterized protein YhaN
MGEKLLGGTAGFFVMDDPFLASDLDRMDRQFSILKELVKTGWQVLYFTARKDLAESLQKLFSIKYETLEPLR